MGVMSCSRIGCDNIMCDRYSGNHGYICDDCFEELVASKKSVSKFMKSDKSVSDDSPYTYEYYEEIFSRD